MRSPLSRWKHFRPLAHCASPSHSPVQAARLVAESSFPPDNGGRAVQVMLISVEGFACKILRFVQMGVEVGITHSANKLSLTFSIFNAFC